MKRKLLARVFLFVFIIPLLAAITVACSDDDDIPVVMITVASKKGDCYYPDGVQSECLLVKEEDAAEWQYFYSPIDGFVYEEGYEYVLLVEKTPALDEEVVQDGASVKYTLVRVASKVEKESDLGGLTM